METIDVGELTFRVVRSKRRSVCIRIGKDGNAEVLAPLKCGTQSLKKVIEPYYDKMLRLYKDTQKRLTLQSEFSVNYGDSVRFLGGERRITTSDRYGYDDKFFYVPSGLDSDGIRSAVIGIYKTAASEYLTERVRAVASRLGFEPCAVKINSARSHWASASRRQSLNFAWYCIMAEPDAVDYIIIHELCHFREFNHSARFWRLVEAYCSEYKNHRSYLKKLCGIIEAEGWYM